LNDRRIKDYFELEERRNLPQIFSSSPSISELPFAASFGARPSAASCELAEKVSSFEGERD